MAEGKMVFSEKDQQIMEFIMAKDLLIDILPTKQLTAKQYDVDHSVRSPTSKHPALSVDIMNSHCKLQHDENKMLDASPYRHNYNLMDDQRVVGRKSQIMKDQAVTQFVEQSEKDRAQPDAPFLQVRQQQKQNLETLDKFIDSLEPTKREVFKHFVVVNQIQAELVQSFDSIEKYQKFLDENWEAMAGGYKEWAASQ